MWNPRSQTETYVALKLEIDNWRWSGVPFFLRTGKSLAKSVTEIAVQFSWPAPARLFPEVASARTPVNQIVFEMKPGQGIHLTFGARAPGLDNQVMPGDMAVEFPPGPCGANAQGYERAIARCVMLGNLLLFPSAAFIEQGWRLIQPLLDAWAPRQGKRTFRSTRLAAQWTWRKRPRCWRIRATSGAGLAEGLGSTKAPLLPRKLATRSASARHSTPRSASHASL